MPVYFTWVTGTPCKRNGKLVHTQSKGEIHNFARQKEGWQPAKYNLEYNINAKQLLMDWKRTEQTFRIQLALSGIWLNSLTHVNSQIMTTTEESAQYHKICAWMTLQDLVCRSCNQMESEGVEVTVVVDEHECSSLSCRRLELASTWHKPAISIWLFMNHNHNIYLTLNS